MNRIIFLFVLICFLYSCGSGNQQSQSAGDDVGSSLLISAAHQGFFDHLQLLCGKTFSGKQVYRSHHGESWADRELVMYVRDCDPERLAIPFRVGDDYSRTWLFLVEEGHLRFRHDHRYPDGRPEEETLYGGYADDNGTTFVQYFPADDYTARLIEDGGGNVWTVSIDENFTVFSYMLERDGEKRFRIDFDISKPLDSDAF